MSEAGNKESRVAIVTGGSSGIGRATVERYLSAGYRVQTCGRDAGKMEAVLSALDTDAAAGRSADVSDPDTAKLLVQETVDRWGRLDVLVSAHGITGNFHKIKDMPPEEWKSVLDTNLMGPIYLTAAAVDPLTATGGAIVYVASINAIQSEPWVAPYGVSKTALTGLTRYAAEELAELGVRVNAVLPGWVDTPLARPFFEEAGVLDRPIATNLLKRPAKPSEIADVIEFLGSERASFITGECLVADGGQHMKLAALEPAADDDAA